MIFPPCEGHADLPHDLRSAETVDKAHGRIEIRTCTTSAEVVPHLDWPGAAQVVRIQRTREIKGTATTEIAYYVTSLMPAEADPRRLLDLARAHWGIENKLHWRRDVSMNEDAAVSGPAPGPSQPCAISSSPCCAPRAWRSPPHAKPTPPTHQPPSTPSPAGFFEWP